MPSQRTALITGGAGFIGSHLCELLLANNWKVRVIDDLSTGARENIPSGADFIEGDINDQRIAREVCAGVDTLYHLAAKVSVRNSVDDFYDDARVNLLGTLSMLSGAAREKVRRFVLASSMAVYGEAPYGKPVDEKHLIAPLSPYGASKYAAELNIFILAKELGVEAVALRLFNTYGTRQGYSPYVGVITIFITNILMNRPCHIFGDGRQCRDFVHVGDVAEAFRLSAEADGAVGQVFNIGSGRGTTVNEIAELIGGCLGRGEFQHSEKLASELAYSVASISKAERLLGYSPGGVLEDRIGEVIEFVSGRLQADQSSP